MDKLPTELEQLGLDHETLELMQEYNPKKYLLEGAIPTGIPNVYYGQVPFENFIKNGKIRLVLFGPSGAGKESAMKSSIEANLIHHVVSSTTREWRKEKEDFGDYHWIHETKLPGESDSDYENRIAEKYHMIEHSFHHGNVYGITLESIKEADEQDLPEIIRTENSGAETIQQEFGNDSNVILIFITAPDYETLAKRIQGRNDFAKRMSKAPFEVRDAKAISNFIIINEDDPEGNISGENKISESFKSLVELIVNAIAA